MPNEVGSQTQTHKNVEGMIKAYIQTVPPEMRAACLEQLIRRLKAEPYRRHEIRFAPGRARITGPRRVLGHRLDHTA